MKLKQQPEDFQVEELTDVIPGEQGPFALYRLEKSGWTTPDAIQAIRRRWRLTPGRISYGGLKDRHAHTIQYLSIFHGPERRLTHQQVTLEYLGRIAEPYTSRAIRANRFQVILRDLDSGKATRAHNALDEVRRDGLPNYFDDQRFGSVSGTAFVARLMVLGRYEAALRTALTAPYEHDRSAQKKEKAILRTHWGDWAACKARLSRGHAWSLVDYLVRQPADFRGALAQLRPELHGLYLSVYQSHLWNRMLARWLEQHLRREQWVWVRQRRGEVLMFRGLNEAQRLELSQLHLPLPSARIHLDPADPRLALMEAVLAEEGLELAQLKLKGFRGMFFSKGERAALCLAADLRAVIADDERHPGRHKLTVTCELPRGAYTTLLIKRITACRGAGERRD